VTGVTVPPAADVSSGASDGSDDLDAAEEAAGPQPVPLTEPRDGVPEPMTDPGELARAVRTLLDFPDRATAVGKAGRARVAERFSWEASVAALGDLYASLEPGWIANVPEGSVT